MKVSLKLSLNLLSYYIHGPRTGPGGPDRIGLEINKSWIDGLQSPSRTVGLGWAGLDLTFKVDPARARARPSLISMNRSRI
jgi:hypothetical protein